MAAEGAAAVAVAESQKQPPVKEEKVEEEDDGKFNPKVKSLKVAADAPFFPAVGDLEGVEALKCRVWKTFEDPECASMALYMNIFVLFLILSSAVVAVIETIPGLHNRTKMVWFGVEAFYVGNFTLEFLLRFWACPDKNEFVNGGMNWVDIISIIPFYIELILAELLDLNLKFLRILRLGRALRLVKLIRYSVGMQMITHCLATSGDALQLFGFIFSALFIVCSSGIYYAERGEYRPNECVVGRNGGPDCYYRQHPISKQFSISPFQSVPDSIWWCIVTLTTVGYGDAFPITYFGQLIGFVTQMLGVLCLALPLSIIGSNFHEIRQELKDMEARGWAEEEEEEEEIDTPCDAADRIGDACEEAEKMQDLIASMCKSVDFLIQLQAMGTQDPAALVGTEVEHSPLYVSPQAEAAATPEPTPEEEAAGIDAAVELELMALESELGVDGRITPPADRPPSPDPAAPSENGGMSNGAAGLGVVTTAGQVHVLEPFHVDTLEKLVKEALKQTTDLYKQL